jgi:hypothetical protein
MQLRAVQFVPEKMTKRNLFAEMTEGFDESSFYADSFGQPCCAGAVGSVM